MKPAKNNLIERIVDANINRAKEGLRVCEEITRFLLNNRVLTANLKGIRHKIDAALELAPQKAELLRLRYSLKDVGFGIRQELEFRRLSLNDIFFANMARVKESVRVLEEFSKLSNTKLALQFKKIRYEVYEIEKKIAGKLPALRHH
ncbi:MAG: thiamine-phosphate pyrophosphorylase [Candidatus Omnitrophica bacterium]|nr:thiamine-phosphate pyrophosphorylase [Candidatus Omnitrophota bacterium]